MLTVEETEEVQSQYLRRHNLGCGSSITFAGALVLPPLRAIAPPASRQLDDAEADYLREKRAFERLLPALLETHPGMFVAIHHGSPTMFGASDVELARAFFKELGDVPVYIGFVGEEPLAHQIPPRR